MTIMVGCTRAGTKYTVDNSEGMCDGNGDSTDAYYKVVDAYDASLPELTLHSNIYCRVDGLQYIVSCIDGVNLECMQPYSPYSIGKQKSLQIPISIFFHNFSHSPIPDSQKPDQNLRLLHLAWRE